MEEKRKKPRYEFYIPVYFPEYKSWGYTKDISSEGCGIDTDLTLAEGMVTTIIMDMPIVGPINLMGYVQHYYKKSKKTGFQLILVRHSPDMAEYYNIYYQFVKSVSHLREIKKMYADYKRKGIISPFQLPDYTLTISEHA